MNRIKPIRDENAGLITIRDPMIIPITYTPDGTVTPGI